MWRRSKRLGACPACLNSMRSLTRNSRAFRSPSSEESRGDQTATAVCLQGRPRLHLCSTMASDSQQVGTSQASEVSMPKTKRVSLLLTQVLFVQRLSSPSDAPSGHTPRYRGQDSLKSRQVSHGRQPMEITALVACWL